MPSYFAVAVLFTATTYLLGVGWMYLRTRPLRVVHCPATHGAASLQLGAGRAALGLGLGPRPRVKDCSLWPERRLCAQACLAEVEASPEHCAFQRILAHWYVGKRCAFCCRGIPAVHRGELRPSLLTPEGRLLPWSDIAPTTVYDVLSTHRPVCASCHVAETFRRQHADLVVERPLPTSHDRWQSPSA